MPGNVCGGTKQSPVNILTSKVKTDPDLQNFTLNMFTSEQAVKSIMFNGHTVKCFLEEGDIEVSGGGLSGRYSAFQFHFHWGQTDYTTHPGSEHTVDGHRYPMEMHIVTVKKGLTVSEATKHPDGLAVLGFFINATEEFEDTKMSEQWKWLTDYLTVITEKPEEVLVNHSISLEKLIGHVDLTKFYRYMGSLTTPNCTESVVWTVFHEPIQVKKDLILKFPSVTSKTDVYRPIQDLKGRQVYASPATPLPSHSWCYDDHCEHSLSHWALLPDSHCDGEQQSPIDIDTHDVTLNDRLGPFTFTKFDDKHAIKYIINTGHSVKCVLNENLVEVSGGGLEHVYSTLQFHFHWGSESDDSKGSEHTVDSKRYPMELHIVNKRKDLTLEDALKTPDGLAVLGFFIEPPLSRKSSSLGLEDHGTTNPTSSLSSEMDAWKKLTHYLTEVQSINSQVDVTDEISIDNLLGSVNRESYFRYSGSLTTPSCNEAVVWTVFKESVKVDHDLFCNGTRQSPINIVSEDATVNENLTAFTFTNYDNKSALQKIDNTGKTVQVQLQPGVKISGGALSGDYDSLQFHLHWGNGLSIPGSEHAVDGKRYPMELHIVNSKSSYKRNTTQAVKDPEGLAALGFFIEAMPGNKTGQPASWNTLTSYLRNISLEGESVTMTPGISLNDLLDGVDQTKYYRYLGSLTTPTCDEAVVWTVFKDPIRISKDLINRFSTMLRISNTTSSPLMVNVFRSIQPAQPVSTQPARSSSSGTKLGYLAGLMPLSLLLWSKI
ncbi:uncharacterized protein FYW49_018402 [Xenentodon cancila]